MLASSPVPTLNHNSDSGGNTTDSLNCGKTLELIATAIVLLSGLFTAQVSMAAGFPATVEHAFGTTAVPARPERIVSVGYVEQDFLYALGIAPIGIRDWWGGHPYATWPWADAARQAVKAEPAVMPGEELNLEWVLSQNPDLILAVYQDITQADYDALSKIAPVVAMPKGYTTWGAPWQEELKIIDMATSGGTEGANKIIADIGKKFDAVHVAYPQFAGKTATNLYLRDGGFLAYGPEDTASRFVTDLGFTFPPQLAAEATDDAYNSIDISVENMRLLDLDAVIWPIDAGENTRARVEAMPPYQNLRLGKEARSLWLDDGQGTFAGALSFQSPLSIAYLLDIVPPMLAAAIDGDAATVPEILR